MAAEIGGAIGIAFVALLEEAPPQDGCRATEADIRLWISKAETVVTIDWDRFIGR